MPQYSYFVNVNSGQVLDVQDASKAADASVVQNPKEGSTSPDVPNQVWEVVSIDDYHGPLPVQSLMGPVLIYNKNSGLVLDVETASKAAGTRVIQYPKHDYNSPELPNQLWIIQAVKATEPNTHSYIINVNSGLLLDVDNASKAPGAIVIQYPKHTLAPPDLPNQVWEWGFVV